MPEVGLQRPRVVSFVCKRVTTSMPQHMRVRLERELGLLARSLDHPRETGGAKRRATLRGEHES